MPVKGMGSEQDKLKKGGEPGWFTNPAGAYKRWFPDSNEPADVAARAALAAAGTDLVEYVEGIVEEYQATVEGEKRHNRIRARALHGINNPAPIKCKSEYPVNPGRGKKAKAVVVETEVDIVESSVASDTCSSPSSARVLLRPAPSSPAAYRRAGGSGIEVWRTD